MSISETSTRLTQHGFSFAKDGILFVASVTLDPLMYDEGDADQVIQEVVDMLDGWADSGTVSGGKTIAHDFTITPTP